MWVSDVLENDNDSKLKFMSVDGYLNYAAAIYSPTEVINPIQPRPGDKRKLEDSEDDEHPRKKQRAGE